MWGQEQPVVSQEYKSGQGQERGGACYRVSGLHRIRSAKSQKRNMSEQQPALNMFDVCVTVQSVHSSTLVNFM